MSTQVSTHLKPETAPAPVAWRGPRLQRKCACGGDAGPSGECEKCQRKSLSLQRRANNQEEVTAIPPVVHEVLRSTGEPLDLAARAFMEPRFGYDFGLVRVHHDAKAVESVRAVNAQAYTVGQDVVFGANAYAPSTDGGRELLAHELAHTVQQRNANGAAPSSESAGALETSAAAAGHTIAKGGTVSPNLPISGVGLARAPVSPEAFNDEELAEEITRATTNLKSGDEPGWWLRALQTESNRRGRGRAKAETGAREDAERAALEAQAAAAIARYEQLEEKWKKQEEEDDDDTPRPKASRKHKIAGGRPTSLSSIQPEPQLEAEQERMAAYYEEAVRDLKETEERLAPPKDRRSLKDRLAQARADIFDLKPDFSAIWSYGLHHGLFATYEEDSVRAAYERPRDEKAGKQFEQDKAKAAEEQINRFRNLRSQLNLAPIQGAVVGGAGAFGNFVKGAYNVFSVADTEVQTHRAATSGDPSDVFGPVLGVLGGILFHETIGGGKPAPTSAGGGKPVTSAGVEEVTPAQVREAYNTNPYSVQKSTGSEWHQKQWEASGGTKDSPAPIAFRTKEGMIRVDEVRWLAVGDLSEINSPADLAVSAPAKPAKAAVDPLAKTGQVADPQGERPAPPNPRQTQYTPPPTPKTGAPPAALKGPRGYTPVQPAVVIEAYQINPHVISISGSTKFHQKVWTDGGSPGDAPVAYRVGDGIRVDIERWPADQRALIGL